MLSSIWVAPVIALGLEQATFRIAYVHELDFGWVPGFIFDHDGTIAAADYVIASTAAFMVFTFSSLLVAIQVASGQLTPRIIATTLLRDNAIRGSVAVFVYALLLAVAVKTRVDTIPHFLISLMGLLGLISVVVFMFLIDYAARLLRPVSIIGLVARRGLRVIDDVYPQDISASPAVVPTRANLGPAERSIPHEDSSAIVIAINVKALVGVAKRHDAIIECVPRVGDFVARSEPLFLLRGPGAANVNKDQLRAQVAFGPERTIEQDSTFAFRVIVDIAIKALSPAINDPTTAVLAIDQLQRLLRSVGTRDLQDESIFDNFGAPLVILRTPNWNDFVYLAFSEIRRYGAGSFQVARRLRAMIESLLQMLPESRQAAVREQQALLDRAITELYPFPEDLTLALIPDSQGMGGASLS